MHQDIPSTEALPSLLATQLLASEVYADYLRLSSEQEKPLWTIMLEAELDHIAFLRNILHLPAANDLCFPMVNVERLRRICRQVLRNGQDSFLLRLEGALRLESAELDYGLEGLVARRLDQSHLLAGCSESIAEHINFLLASAERYRESPNIGKQMQRLSDLLETSFSNTGYIVSGNTPTIQP